MKNLIYGCLIFFLGLSCKKNCQDCGVTSTGTYIVENKTGGNLKINFYRVVNNIEEINTINIQNNEKTNFILAQTGSPLKYNLPYKEYLYDSFSISKDDKIIASKIKWIDCTEKLNLFCTSNYVKINETKIDSGKNYGGTSSEYVLIFR